MNHKNLFSGQSQSDSSSVFPLSIPQRGLWFAHHIVPDATGKVFKVAGHVNLTGKIIPEVMEAAVRQAVSEAETLHITTTYNDGKLFQTINLFSSWAFPVIDLSQSESSDTAVIEWIDARLDIPVSLEQKAHCLTLRC
ncbi:condensation domain-containing protein [Vibrio sp. PP-XX7]